MLERFLDDVQSLTARFEQQLYTADGRLVETSTGTMAVKRPEQFRWSTEEPFETLLVTDGDTLWMYDVEIAQVTRMAVDDTAPASPAMLLSGDRGIRDSFEFVATAADDGLTWVLLEPKLAGGDFNAVRLAFDGELLVRMELVDGLDQTTTIEFLDVAVNAELDDELFRFEIPRGVDVLGDAG